MHKLGWFWRLGSPKVIDHNGKLSVWVGMYMCQSQLRQCRGFQHSIPTRTIFRVSSNSPAHTHTHAHTHASLRGPFKSACSYQNDPGPRTRPLARAATSVQPGTTGVAADLRLRTDTDWVVIDTLHTHDRQFTIPISVL